MGPGVIATGAATVVVVAIVNLGSYPGATAIPRKFSQRKENKRRGFKEFQLALIVNIRST